MQHSLAWVVGLAVVTMSCRGGFDAVPEPLVVDPGPLETVVGAAPVDVSANVAGGVPPYSYAVTGGGAVTSDGLFTASADGAATVTVTDDAGQTADVAIDVVGAALSLDLSAAPIDARVAVSRSGPATFVDSNGLVQLAAPNTARITFDPLDGAARGLLVEPERTNLAVRSTDLASLTWLSNGAGNVIGDAEMAPDGTTEADIIEDLETLMISRYYLPIPVPDDDATYTYSVFFKAGTAGTGALGAELLGGSTLRQVLVQVDLSDGSIESSNADSEGVDAYPDGWYRVWAVVANNATGNQEALLSVYSNFNDSEATGTVIAWGAQLEVGARPSSFIPTVGTTETRTADVVTVQAGDWLVGNRGTLVATAAAEPSDGASQTLLCLHQTTAIVQAVCASRDPSNARVRVDQVVDDAVVAALTGASWAASEYRTVALSIGDQLAAASDGESIGTEQAGEFAQSLTVLTLGADNDGAASLDGTVLSLRYYPAALPVVDLVALTEPDPTN